MPDRVAMGRMSVICPLFGIPNAGESQKTPGYDLAYDASLRGSRDSMGREIREGRNLSEYVEVKEAYRNWPQGPAQ